MSEQPEKQSGSSVNGSNAREMSGFVDTTGLLTRKRGTEREEWPLVDESMAHACILSPVCASDDMLACSS